MPSSTATSWRTWIDVARVMNTVRSVGTRLGVSQRSAQVSLLPTQHSTGGRYAHRPQNLAQMRLQQLGVGGVLALLVLLLLYFDSGSPKAGSESQYTRVQPHDGSGAGSSGGASATLQGGDRSTGDGSTSLSSECRAMAALQVCSHRTSLSGNDTHATELPLVERMVALAAAGVACYDVDVVTTSDGKLVVGYGPHIAAALHKAGRPVKAGQQVESVPWSEYVQASLTERYPQLAEVLAAFEQVVVQTGHKAASAASSGSSSGGAGASDSTAGTATAAAAAGNAAGGAAATDGAAAAATAGGTGDGAAAQAVTGTKQDQAGTNAAAAGGSSAEGEGAAAAAGGNTGGTGSTGEAGSAAAGAAAMDGGRHRFRLNRDRHYHRRRQLQQDAAGAGSITSATDTGTGSSSKQQQQRPLLLIELKDGAISERSVGLLHNLTSGLGVERFVGVWVVRRPVPHPATKEVDAYMRRPGVELVKVLGLPDSSRLPNGTFAPIPESEAEALLQSADPFPPASYDAYGPSARHADALLQQISTLALAGGGAAGAGAEGATGAAATATGDAGTGGGVGGVGGVGESGGGGGSAKPVVWWMVESVEEARRAARLGASAIVSNDPLGLAAQLAAATAACGGGDGSAGGSAAGEANKAGAKRTVAGLTEAGEGGQAEEVAGGGSEQGAKAEEEAEAGDAALAAEQAGGNESGEGAGDSAERR